MISETRKDQEARTRDVTDVSGPDASVRIDRSDAETIRKIIAGDRHAFSRLTAKYQDRLFNSLTYALQDRIEAEDVVQEAFTQAYVKLGQFRYDGAFYTWLYRIAWNIAATRRRRHQRRREVSLEQLCEASGKELAVAPSAAREDRDDSIYRVHKALAGVGDRYRTVLILRHMEGHSYETIAEMLDLPVGTVRSRIHRGRIELRRKLERQLRAVK